MYQSNVYGKDNSKNKVFRVPIFNTKNTEMHYFDPHAPEIKYVQDENNTCVLGNMASDLFVVN